MKFTFLLSILLIGSAAIAATPDAGSIESQIKQERALRPQVPLFPVPSIKATEQPDASAATVFIRRIEWTGNAHVPTAELQADFSSALNRAYTFAQLQALTLRVGEYYRSKGLLARGILPAQQLRDGVLHIRVIEGTLGQITIRHDEDHLNFDIEKSKEFLRYGQPDNGLFGITAFQRAIKTLDSVPGVTASAVLTPGQALGETDVLVKMANTPTETGSLRLDNHASRATSSQGLRVTGYLNLDGLFEQGEQLNAQLIHSRGSDVLTLGGSTLWGRDGARIGANLSWLRYALGEPLTVLMGRGDSQAWDVFVDKPLRNDERGVSRVRLDFSARQYRDLMSGLTLSDKSVRAWNASWIGAWPDGWGGQSSNILSAALTWGQVRLNGFDDPRNVEGSYWKGRLLFNRAQYVNEKTELFMAFSAQYAGRNLDSSEKLALGGPTSVRAYPLGEASGDHGAILTLELRHQLSEKLQGLLFYDHGWVQQDRTPYLGQATPQQVQLMGLGLGLKWQVAQQLECVASVSTRLGHNPLADASGLDSDGTHRAPRFWFSLVRAF